MSDNEELDAIVRKRVEAARAQDRQAMDARLKQLEAQAQWQSQTLGRISQYFDAAQQDAMTPEQRAELMQQQQAQALSVAALKLRQSNAYARAQEALHDLGFRWNDPRIQWPDHQWWDADPDSYATEIIKQAALLARKQLRRERTPESPASEPPAESRDDDDEYPWQQRLRDAGPPGSRARLRALETMNKKIQRGARRPEDL